MLQAPRIPVFSNVTGKPFRGPEEIAGMLCRQLVEPVQWESTLKVSDTGRPSPQMYNVSV